MGNFSRDTFDKLKHYVGVRLQQGVPLVDADWNELEDIRKYEVQAFLKWFVGSGVPNGNDGFRILATAGSNDFDIQGGDGTAEGAGRILVEGWDALIESNMKYTEQPLYANAALAAELGVAAIPPLTTPGPDRMDTVYLDVWEREVNAQEDFAQLVNPNIGIETCVRVKREWAVRVAEDANSPPATTNGHVFYPLSTLTRRAGDDTILADDVADLRLTELTVVSQNDINQMVTDAFGTSYALDHDGQPNLKVSLREAINAILRGGLPSTSEQQFTLDAAFDALSVTLQDSTGDIWIFWVSDRTGDYQIWYNRYTPSNDTWQGEIQLTSINWSGYWPRIVEDDNGNIWVFWVSSSSGNRDIWYNRYIRNSDSWEGDTQLTTAADDDDQPSAVTDDTGDIWLFWRRTVGGNEDIWYDRFVAANNSWDGETQLTTSADDDEEPIALKDSNGDIWLFWTRTISGNDDIWYNRFTSGAWQGEVQRTSDTDDDDQPFAVEDSQGDIWLFWRSFRNSNYDIWYNRYIRASDTWDGDTQLTVTSESDHDPFALADSNGGIWVFWRSLSSGNNDIWYKRFSPDSGWGTSVQLTTSADDDWVVFAMEDVEGDIWVFWTRLAGATLDIFYRKLIPSI